MKQRFIVTIVMALIAAFVVIIVPDQTDPTTGVITPGGTARYAYDA
jgi:hypothetical protein